MEITEKPSVVTGASFVQTECCHGASFVITGGTNNL